MIRLLMIALTLVSSAALAQLDRLDSSTPREVQIKLAKEAAPPEVSDHATIMVLGKQGYEVAVKGTNGFTCLVLHERVDTVEPECFDAEGSRTLLPANLFAERELAKGVSNGEIVNKVDAGFKSGRFKTPSRPGLVYMLSPHNRIYDADSHRVISVGGHLMFYAPYATEKSVGSGKGAPNVADPGKPYALMIVVPRS